MHLDVIGTVPLKSGKKRQNEMKMVIYLVEIENDKKHAL